MVNQQYSVYDAFLPFYFPSLQLCFVRFRKSLHRNVAFLAAPNISIDTEMRFSGGAF